MVQEKVLQHAEELFVQGDTNCDGKLASDELRELLLLVRRPPTERMPVHIHRVQGVKAVVCQKWGLACAMRTCRTEKRT